MRSAISLLGPRRPSRAGNVGLTLGIVLGAILLALRPFRRKHVRDAQA